MLLDNVIVFCPSVPMSLFVFRQTCRLV